MGHLNHEGLAETARDLLTDYQSSLTSDGSYLFSAETIEFTDSLVAATISG